MRLANRVRCRHAPIQPVRVILNRYSCFLPSGMRFLRTYVHENVGLIPPDALLANASEIAIAATYCVCGGEQPRGTATEDDQLVRFAGRGLRQPRGRTLARPRSGAPSRWRDESSLRIA